jgi:lipoprotein-anchoring transpeptidase ErfK/SrfK
MAKTRALSDKVIKVSLSQQIVEAYDGPQRVFVFKCVSGDREHPTDIGQFTIWDKRHPWISGTYHVQMNYALFFTRDGKALHQYHGQVPLGLLRVARHWISRWFGSHGCVRLSEVDAKALWDWTPFGTPVHVSK